MKVRRVPTQILPVYGFYVVNILLHVYIFTCVEDGEGGEGDEEEDGQEEFANHLFNQLVEKFKREHKGKQL